MRTFLLYLRACYAQKKWVVKYILYVFKCTLFCSEKIFYVPQNVFHIIKNMSVCMEKYLSHTLDSRALLFSRACLKKRPPKGRENYDVRRVGARIPRKIVVLTIERD